MCLGPVPQFIPITSIGNGARAVNAAGFSLDGGFAANGYAEHSPGKYALGACFAIEVAMTAFFLLIILGATEKIAAGDAVAKSRQNYKATGQPPRVLKRLP